MGIFASSPDYTEDEMNRYRLRNLDQKDQYWKNEYNRHHMGGNGAYQYNGETNHLQKASPITNDKGEEYNYGLVNALTDPTSGVSSMYNYGRSPDFTRQDFDYQNSLGEQFANRGNVQANYGDANRTRTDQVLLAGQMRSNLDGTNAGPAGQQLASSYAATNSGLANAANYMGGGPAAAAAARAAASQIAGNNVMDQNTNVRLLGAQNAANSATQLNSISNTLRGQAQEQAIKQAELAQASMGQNRGMTAAAGARGVTALQAGVQGGINRQGARRDALTQAYGHANVMDKQQREADDLRFRTTLGGIQSGVTSIGTLVNASKPKDNQGKP